MATLPEVKHNIRIRTADYIDAYFNEHERYPVDIGLIHGDFIADELYAGFSWSDTVESFYDPTSGLPSNPLIFTRYISTQTANGWKEGFIYAWDGIEWIQQDRKEGQPVYVKDEKNHYFWNGDEWTLMVGSGGTTDHRDLDHLNSTSYWHLTHDEYFTLLGLPDVINGKEDKGIASSLLEDHESNWNHDLFMTELPSHSHLWADITDKPSTFAPSEHYHDDRYYTETETNNLLNNKENILGSPSTNGYILSSTTAGVRSWIAPYSHPTQSAISPTLSGANVLASLSVNSFGHVTAATTRTLTPANIGAQPSNSNLTAIAGLTPTDGNFIIGNGSTFVGRKLQNSDLPAIAITDTFVVNSQAAMLALSTAERGDVAVRTDLNKSFILKGDNPATLSDWQELLTPTDAVLSVDGRTGVVSLSDKYQPLDADLIDIAGLTHSNRHVLVSDGSKWTRRALVAEDIPNLSAAKITSGTLDNTRLSFDIADYVTIATSQTITGAKKFSEGITGITPADFNDIGTNNAARFTLFSASFQRPNGPSGANYWSGIEIRHNIVEDYRSQLLMGTTGAIPQLAIRNKSAGASWGSWVYAWHTANFDPSTKANATHGHPWGDITGKPSTYAPAAHTLVSHSDWSTYFDQALKTTSSPTFAKLVLGTRPANEHRWTLALDQHNTLYSLPSAALNIMHNLYHDGNNWRYRYGSGNSGGVVTTLAYNQFSVNVADNGVADQIATLTPAIHTNLSGNTAIGKNSFVGGYRLEVEGNQLINGNETITGNIDVGGTVDIRGDYVRFRNGNNTDWDLPIRYLKDPGTINKGLYLFDVKSIYARGTDELFISSTGGGIMLNGKSTFNGNIIHQPISIYNTLGESWNQVYRKSVKLGYLAPDNVIIPKAGAVEGQEVTIFNNSGKAVVLDSKYRLLNGETMSLVYFSNNWLPMNKSTVGEELILPGSTPTINLRGAQWGAIIFGDSTQGHAISRNSTSGTFVFSRLYDNVTYNLMGFSGNGVYFFQPVYLDPSKVKAGTSQAGAGAAAGELWRNTSTGALHLGI